MPHLNNGDAFPILALDTVGDGTVSVTHYLAGSHGVVLMYRGSWCPYCNAQLSAFARAKEKLDELGIKIIAVSVDSKADAMAVAEKHRLNFPVGYGVCRQGRCLHRRLRQRQPALPAIDRICARSRWKGDHCRLLQRPDREVGRRRRDRLRPVREVQGLIANRA